MLCENERVRGLTTATLLACRLELEKHLQEIDDEIFCNL